MQKKIVNLRENDEKKGKRENGKDIRKGEAAKNKRICRN